MTSDQHTPAPDDPLADELRQFFSRTDPVPPAVIEAARAAIEFRDLDAQLAELLVDSALQDKELAGVRGVGQRLLTFALGERFLEVDVEAVDGYVQFSGYVVPEQTGVIRAEGPTGAVDATVDERGRFRLVRLPRGPARLWLSIAGEPPLVTPWVSL